MKVKKTMDKWKRNASGELVNDDQIGYENAKKRIQIRNKRKEDQEILNERLEGINERIEDLERKVQGMDLTIKEIIKLCHSITEALKRM